MRTDMDYRKCTVTLPRVYHYDDLQEYPEQIDEETYLAFGMWFTPDEPHPTIMMGLGIDNLESLDQCFYLMGEGQYPERAAKFSDTRKRVQMYLEQLREVERMQRKRLEARGNGIVQQDIIEKYEALVAAHKEAFPTFDAERFNKNVEGVWRMRQVIREGVAAVNKRFRKRESGRRWMAKE